MNYALWSGLALVVLFRLAWLAKYVCVAGRRSLRLLTSQLYDVDEDAGGAIHQSVAAVTEKLLENCLIVGTLALAAWTALFAVAEQPPAKELTSTTRFLLLVGSAVLICAPMVFREPDRHLSYIGRSSTLYTGLAAVGLSLASIFYDLVHWWAGMAIAAAVAVVLVGRDIVESVTEMRRLEAVRHAVVRLSSTVPDDPPAESVPQTQVRSYRVSLRIRRAAGGCRRQLVLQAVEDTAEDLGSRHEDNALPGRQRMTIQNDQGGRIRTETGEDGVLSWTVTSPGEAVAVRTRDRSDGEATPAAEEIRHTIERFTLTLSAGRLLPPGEPRCRAR